MILYGSPISPFVRKVMIFAAEKGVALELVPVARQSDNPDFRAASPFGKMPALADGDFRLADSSAIIAYLDALKPEPNLIPAAPRARGQVIWFEEFADSILGEAVLAIFFNRVVGKFLKLPVDDARADQAEAELVPPRYDYLDQVLMDQDWLVDNRFTLADIAVSVMLSNLPYAGVGLDEARWPSVAAWMKRVGQQPSVAHANAILEKAMEKLGFAHSK